MNRARGMLSISAPDTFGPMHVAPAVPEFLSRFPGLAIDISLSPRHVDPVQEGLDLAIRIGTRSPEADILSTR